MSEFPAQSSSARVVDWDRLNENQTAQLAGVYREAFEAAWEMPGDQLLLGAEAWRTQWPNRRVLASLLEERVVGMATIKYLVQSHFLYLEYLAVDGTRRSAGLGSQLFGSIVALGAEVAKDLSAPPPRGLVWEVELLGAPPLSADRTLRRRRCQFYERMGGQYLGVSEPRPPWAPPAMPDWEIMFLPLADWPATTTTLLRREVAQAVLVEGYGRSPDEPWLAPYLASIS
jgi:GNAT superfamily N-acetyltransferase